MKLERALRSICFDGFTHLLAVPVNGTSTVISTPRMRSSTGRGLMVRRQGRMNKEKPSIPVVICFEWSYSVQEIANRSQRSFESDLRPLSLMQAIDHRKIERFLPRCQEGCIYPLEMSCLHGMTLWACLRVVCSTTFCSVDRSNVEDATVQEITLKLRQELLLSLTRICDVVLVLRISVDVM